MLTEARGDRGCCRLRILLILLSDLKDEAGVMLKDELDLVMLSASRADFMELDFPALIFIKVNTQEPFQHAFLVLYVCRDESE